MSDERRVVVLQHLREAIAVCQEAQAVGSDIQLDPAPIIALLRQGVAFATGSVPVISKSALDLATAVLHDDGAEPGDRWVGGPVAGPPPEIKADNGSIVPGRQARELDRGLLRALNNPQSVSDGAE
jgi:hypothetical protein